MFSTCGLTVAGVDVSKELLLLNSLKDCACSVAGAGLYYPPPLVGKVQNHNRGQ